MERFGHHSYIISHNPEYTVARGKCMEVGAGGKVTQFQTILENKVLFLDIFSSLYNIVGFIKFTINNMDMVNKNRYTGRGIRKAGQVVH